MQVGGRDQFKRSWPDALEAVVADVVKIKGEVEGEVEEED